MYDRYNIIKKPILTIFHLYFQMPVCEIKVSALTLLYYDMYVMMCSSGFLTLHAGVFAYHYGLLRVQYKLDMCKTNRLQNLNKRF